MRGPRGRTLSHLLLPVLGQQQADLRQLLLDDLLVDHVQLQARLRVFGKHPLLGVVLVVAGSTPPFFFLGTGGRPQLRRRGTQAPGGAAGPRATAQPPDRRGCPDAEFHSAPFPSPKAGRLNF